MKPATVWEFLDDAVQSCPDRPAIVGDNGRELPAGETGEICIRGATQGPWAGSYRPMPGYWRRPAATRNTLIDGVLHTGDLGSINDGLLFPKDGRDYLILRGGASVYPAQVERVIGALASVADCAVVGLPDPRLGQRVAVPIETDENTTLRARNTINKVVRRDVVDLIQPMVDVTAHPPGVRHDARPEATGAK